MKCTKNRLKAICLPCLVEWLGFTSARDKDWLEKLIGQLRRGVFLSRIQLNISHKKLLRKHGRPPDAIQAIFCSNGLKKIQMLTDLLSNPCHPRMLRSHGMGTGESPITYNCPFYHPGSMLYASPAWWSGWASPLPGIKTGWRS